MRSVESSGHTIPTLKHMKLLDQYHDISKATELALMLRNEGILTYISSKRSYELGSVRTGVFKVGLWVVLDEQFEDAKKYLKNPNHIIGYKLSEEEMVALESEAEAAFSNNVSGLITKSANWFIALVLLAIIVFISYKAIYAL